LSLDDDIPSADNDDIVGLDTGNVNANKDEELSDFPLLLLS
jgi:hypothetical protein